MALIHFRISDEIVEKLDDIVKEGKYKTRSELIRTAIIEWLKDRELKTIYKKEGKIE